MQFSSNDTFADGGIDGGFSARLGTGTLTSIYGRLGATLAGFGERRGSEALDTLGCLAGSRSSLDSVNATLKFEHLAWRRMHAVV